VLTELYSQVHRALAYLGQSYEECHGMETTLSLCWFTPGWMYFGTSGTAAFIISPNAKVTIKQLSHDDTYVGWMFRNGQINEREARTHPRRNVLQKSLGGSNQFVDPQVGAVGYEPGDIFLLCSDGLTEGLYSHHILDVLRPGQSPAPDHNPARQLVLESVKNDGRDNTTALVIEAK
jgi:serine/threonine protein phosphatase PrpC